MIWPLIGQTLTSQASDWLGWCNNDNGAMAVSWCDQGLIISLAANCPHTHNSNNQALAQLETAQNSAPDAWRHNQSCAICYSGCDWALTIIKLCSLRCLCPASCLCLLGAPLRWVHFIIISSISSLLFSSYLLVILPDSESTMNILNSRWKW